MVGDGINDSAVLAQADLGIAMGQGSDIAIDVEKVTILSSDLTKIAAAVRLSAATVRTVRQNLFWAFIYNLIGVPVAAGVLYPLTRFLLNSMLVGAAMAHNFGTASSGAGIGPYGIHATLIGFAACLLIGFLNSKKA